MLSGRADPSNPLFSPGGSAWTNDTRPFLKISPEQDPRLHPRNRCIHEGFLSVALVPIQVEQEIIGLLQLNDRRPGRFSLETIRFFEGLAASFGVTLQRLWEEQALRESRNTLRALFDAIPESMFLMNLDGHIVAANTAFAARFDRTVEDCVGQNLLQLVPSERVASRRAWMSEVVRTRQAVINEEPWGERWLRHNYCPVFGAEGAVQQIVVLAIDIAARKRVEKEREAALIKYQTLFNVLPVGVTVADSKGCLLESNRAAESILGLINPELTQRPLTAAEWKIVRPDGTPMPPEEFPGLRATREQRLVEGIEMGVVKSPEETTWILATAAPAGLPEAGVVIAYSDITERRRTVAALQASESKYRLLSENSGDVIWLFDLPANRFSYVSPSVKQLRGYTAEEVFGQTMEQVLTPKSYRMVMESLPKRLAEMAAGMESARLQTHEVDQTHKDGSIVPTEAVTTLLTGASGQVVQILGVSRDITARKKAENALAAQLAELQRWHHATVGRETRVLELKAEVNRLLAAAGQPPRYASAATAAAPAA